jgi:Fe-S cluster biogenesis protein NfuA
MKPSFVIAFPIFLAASQVAGASAPVKLAVFDFQLLDFSAGGGMAPPNARDADTLLAVTDKVRELIANSGRYALVKVDKADSDAVKAGTCDGCDAGLASKLGAEQSLVGTVTRISRTEYTVQFQIRDAGSGKVLSTQRSGLRIGADYSWERGAASLVKNRLLDTQAEP